MKKNVALFGTIAALALASATAHATAVVVPVNGPFPPHTSFTISSDPTDLTSVTANFAATTFGASTAFDYAFTFTLPYNGIGGGSLSTSFAGLKTYVDITKVIIDGTTYFPTPLVATTKGQSLVVNNFPITALALNTIEVFGTTGAIAKYGTFSGTATFEASVPEPATWATFLLGFGFIGFGLRRKLGAKLKTA